jgi:hypothetical protein
MTLIEFQNILSKKTGQKVEFGLTQYDATTLSFKKSLYADGRKIDFKWHPDNGKNITVDELIENIVQAINNM